MPVHEFPKTRLKLLVCGGRDFDNYSLLHDVLDGFMVNYVISGIIHGGARGADHMAGVYAKHYGIPCLEFPALWSTYGKSAGFKRNMQMLVEGRPDVVVAFPGGKGTAHMTAIARKAGVLVMEVINEDSCEL